MTKANLPCSLDIHFEYEGLPVLLQSIAGQESKLFFQLLTD